MVDSTIKTARRVRPIGIVAAGTITYFLTLLLVLYVLDRQVYTSKKLEIIAENFSTISGLPDELNPTARIALFNPGVAERKSAQQELEKMMRMVVNGPSIVYRIDLRDASGAISLRAENSTKIARYNTWRNTLFLQNFSGLTRQPVSNETHPIEHGFLSAYYTSPVAYPPIEQITSQFRWLALLIVALWSAGYAFLYEKLLRPVRNVTAYLERSREAPPRLILKSRAHLESAYNQLAARALLQLIEERLSAPTRPDSEGQAEERTAAVSDALSIIADAFAAEKIAAAEIGISHGQAAVTESYSPPAQLDPVNDALLLNQLQPRISDMSHDLIKAEGEFLVNPDSTGFTYLAPLAAGSFLLVTGKLSAGIAGIRARLDGTERACGVLRRAFLAYKAYRQGIFRQRSEANIVLSRNLGHDLTNIIATSKLDLMAVRRLLQTPNGAEGTHGELLSQAVQGLLENTKFLQEIVNIYRSFSNVKRPQFERRDLRGLIEEFLAAFEPSVSARVTIQRELDTPMPAPIVEPRLLKLALFNVLTNALDALRRAAPDSSTPAVIKVRTKYEAASKLYRIEIEDNGPGIRDSEGRLLAPAELQAIFEYGYSTKAESSEGLGLSWVRTIMADFHDGGVTAENLNDAGARLTLLLHSMDRAEAKVG